MYKSELVTGRFQCIHTPSVGGGSAFQTWKKKKKRASEILMFSKKDDKDVIAGAYKKRKEGPENLKLTGHVEGKRNRIKQQNNFSCREL